MSFSGIDPSRRQVVGSIVGSLMGGLVVGCAENTIAAQIGDFFTNSNEFAVDVLVRAKQDLHPANALLCGSNVQWVDGGDGLLPTGSGFDAGVLEKVKRLAPTVLRYPGGSNSDVYAWRAGVGPAGSRGRSEHFHRREKQVVRLGTPEFLALCEAVGAEALITVNVTTGSPSEAAEWLREVNVTGIKSSLTKGNYKPVKYWEIGNEPYLKEDVRPDTWIPPQEYGKRANEAIELMRRVDPSILVGIPLRSDSFNGLPVTPYQGFNEAVLQRVQQKFDFVALHNAYLPFVYDRNPGESEAYAALMAATQTVLADLDATRSQLKRIHPGKNIRIAITEYNALITLGRKSDSLLASPAGAIYIADLLRLLAMQPDVLLANHWSLLGNWYFGAMSSNGKARPAFHALRLLRDFLVGNMVALDVNGPAFSAPSIGLIRSGKAFASVTGAATRKQGEVRVLLINKDPQASAKANIRLADAGVISKVKQKQLRASSIFADAEKDDAFQFAESFATVNASAYLAALPPASVSLFEFVLSKG